MGGNKRPNCCMKSEVGIEMKNNFLTEGLERESCRRVEQWPQLNEIK
jgi:hypothetical protein